MLSCEPRARSTAWAPPVFLVRLLSQKEAPVRSPCTGNLADNHLTPFPRRWEQPPECEGSGSVKDLDFWQEVPGHRTCQPRPTLPLLEHGQCVTHTGDGGWGALYHTSGKRFAQMFGSTLHDSGPGPTMSQPCGPTQRHTPPEMVLR